MPALALGLGFRVRGRALGHFIFSLIVLKRILFTNIFQKAPPRRGLRVEARKLEHGCRRIGARIPYSALRASGYGCSNFLASIIGFRVKGGRVSGLELKGQYSYG